RVAIEVALLDAPVLERDLEPHRSAETVDDRALRLILGAGQVDDRPNIARDPNLVHGDLAIRVDADLRDFREMPVMAEVKCEPEAAARRHRPAPPRLLRRELDHGRRALGAE